MKILLVLLISSSIVFGQVELTKEGYLFRNKEDLIELQFWAHKGKIFEQYKVEVEASLLELKRHGISVDSIFNKMRDNIVSSEYKYGSISKDLQFCQRDRKSLEEDIEKLNRDLKKERRQRFWDKVKYGIGGGLTGIAAGVIITILKS